MDAAECLDLPQEQTSASVALMSQNDPKRTLKPCAGELTRHETAQTPAKPAHRGRLPIPR
jgi:hypothetical protein